MMVYLTFQYSRQFRPLHVMSTVLEIIEINIECDVILCMLLLLVHFIGFIPNFTYLNFDCNVQLFIYLLKKNYMLLNFRIILLYDYTVLTWRYTSYGHILSTKLQLIYAQRLATYNAIRKWKAHIVVGLRTYRCFNLSIIYNIFYEFIHQLLCF